MKPIALTYGMGIGPEIALKALQKYPNPVILMGREESLIQALQGLDFPVFVRASSNDIFRRC